MSVEDSNLQHAIVFCMFPQGQVSLSTLYKVCGGH